MSRITWKGGALLAPVPAVLVTSGTPEAPDVMTVGWTGITDTQPPKTYISVRKSRLTYELIKKSGEFTVNLTTASLAKAVDFCGVRSGRDTDKFKICGLTPVPSQTVAPPSVAESPLTLECKVTDIIEMGSHDMFLADITSVSADEQYIDKNGRLELDRADLLAYVHGEYFRLGAKLGKFGFSVEKKKKKTKAHRKQT